MKYEVDINNTICSELELIRTMAKTLDFSTLPGVVERIQYHASCMEQALWDFHSIKNDVKHALKECDDYNRLKVELEKILEVDKEKSEI